MKVDISSINRSNHAFSELLLSRSSSGTDDSLFVSSFKQRLNSDLNQASFINNSKYEVIESSYNKLSKNLEGSIVSDFYSVLSGFNRSVSNGFVNFLSHKAVRHLKKLQEKLNNIASGGQQKSIKKFKEAHRHKFYDFIYILYGFNLLDNNIESLLSELNKSKVSNRESVEIINQYFAILINDRKEELSPRQLKRIKIAYTNWIYTLNDLGYSQRAFVTRHYDNGFDKFHKPRDNEYKLDNLDKNFDIPQRKKKTKLKRFLKSQYPITVLCTAIALGLVPAVLAAGTTGGLIVSLLVIGIPAVIINIVLYGNSVKEFIKDIINYRLLKNKEGKFIPLSIPLFVISLCGGITYGALTLTTSMTALGAIVTTIFPLMSAFPILLAAIVALPVVVLSFYTFIAYTALFFSSMVDAVRSGVLEGVKKYVNNNYIKLWNSERSLKSKCMLTFLKLSVLIGTISLSAYLTIMEVALVYSLAIVVLPIPPVALALVLIAAPANLLFTFKVYNSLVKTVTNLPSVISSYKENFKYIKSNPVLLYDTMKHLFSWVSFTLLNLINAVGSAKGLGAEICEKNSIKILKPLHINPNNIAVNGLSQLTEFADAYGACQEGIEETLHYSAPKITPIYGVRHKVKENFNYSSDNIKSINYKI